MKTKRKENELNLPEEEGAIPKIQKKSDSRGATCQRDETKQNEAEKEIDLSDYITNPTDRKIE